MTSPATTSRAFLIPVTLTLLRGMETHRRWLGVMARTAAPFVDLLVRLWLAQVFFVSGAIKLTHWQTALDLAANEYPVSWMNPATAAHVGVSIELLGATCLALGLMTRYAALPMLLLSLVIQYQYRALDPQLLWVALFGWYVLTGAGRWSIDSMLRKGLADSALPIVPSVVRASAWVRATLAQPYWALVRIWFASALLCVAFGASNFNVADYLPMQVAQGYVPFVGFAGVLLLLGVATRYAALFLLLVGGTSAMMSGGGQTEVFASLLLLAFIVNGAGSLSVDRGLARWFEKWQPQLRSAAEMSAGLPRIVIVGAGFGGLTCAHALRNANAAVTLIDRTNFHLFQSLLYQVATAGLSPSDIAAPVRPLFRESPRTSVLFGTVTGVDTQRQVVALDTVEVPYDYLVLATGAAHSYFGKDQWAPYAPGLKRIEDATEIRRKLLTAFERAEVTTDPEERAALLTFLIVGGGPTGVELAGAIAELARFGMEKEFRRFDPAQARVVLVQSAPRLLPAFPENLAKIAQRSLEQLGVEVLLGSRVQHIDAHGVRVSGKSIASRQVLWAAGVMASPAAKWLNVPADNAGRVIVGDDLSVPSLPNVFVVGDTALSAAWKGQPVPGLAPAAKQGGKYVARLINARLQGKSASGPFVYRHLGSLATIGRKAAVADFGFIKLWGAPAWWLWGVVHVGFLVGIRNRLSTIVNWFWSYLTFGASIRLITGAAGATSTESARAMTKIEPTAMRQAS